MSTAAAPLARVFSDQRLFVNRREIAYVVDHDRGEIRFAVSVTRAREHVRQLARRYAAGQPVLAELSDALHNLRTLFAEAAALAARTAERRAS